MRGWEVLLVLGMTTPKSLSFQKHGMMKTCFKTIEKHLCSLEKAYQANENGVAALLIIIVSETFRTEIIKRFAQVNKEPNICTQRAT